MNNKKGLSTLVTSLILILLVLVAVGILYAVYINFIEEGTQSMDIGAKCLNVGVSASAVDCSDPKKCAVTLTRTASGNDIAGVKLVFTNSTGSSSGVLDYNSNIESLDSVTTIVDSNILAPNKVEVTVYFEDESGNEQKCSTPSSKSF